MLATPLALSLSLSPCEIRLWESQQALQEIVIHGNRYPDEGSTINQPTGRNLCRWRIILMGLHVYSVSIRGTGFGDSLSDRTNYGRRSEITGARARFGSHGRASIAAAPLQPAPQSGRGPLIRHGDSLTPRVEYNDSLHTRRRMDFRRCLRPGLPLTRASVRPRVRAYLKTEKREEVS